MVILTVRHHAIAMCFPGRPVVVDQWITYAEAFRVSSQGSQADAEIDLEAIPGWANPAVGKDDLAPATEIDGKIVLERPSLLVRLTREEGRFLGSVRTNGDKSISIDFAVSTVLALLCCERGDLLLHASAVLRNGVAMLFLGKGGSGKTTIAVELSSGAAPMSVDRTLISRDESGELAAFGTPFNDTGRDVEGPTQAPIGGIFFIEQAGVHEVLPVDPFEATRLILAQTIVPLRSSENMHRVMEIVGSLVDLNRCYKLRFKRDDGFWQFVDQALARRVDG
jgi:hypothetical protein